MSVCQVNRCCCCVEHSIGVRAMALWLIMIEIACIVVSAYLVPEHVYFLVPIFSVGIICHTLLFIAVHRRSRWFILPWLIYDMLMVVGLSLVAVLLIVIPMGSFNSDHNWTIIGLKACLCLAVAGLFLYFWIVVLELFLKMGPFLMFDPAMMPPGGPPQVPPGTNYPLMYPNTQMYPPMQFQGPPITQQPMYAQYGREKPF